LFHDAEGPTDAGPDFPHDFRKRDARACLQNVRAAAGDGVPAQTIVIGEFAWPSVRHNFEQAVPGPITHAVVLRDFVASASTLSIDHNIVDAIGQSGKGNVDPYWAILDASLQPKFSWTGRSPTPIIMAGSPARRLRRLVLVDLLSGTSRAIVGQKVLLAGADDVIGDWCASVLG